MDVARTCMKSHFAQGFSFVSWEKIDNKQEKITCKLKTT